MFGRNDRGERNRLDTAWDALCVPEGARTARAADDDLGQTLRVMGRLDDAPAPSPAFVVRLREHLQQHVAAQSAVGAAGQAGLGSMRDTVPVHQQPGTSGRRSWVATGRHAGRQLATAVVLVTLVGGGIALFRPHLFGAGGPPPTYAAPSLIASGGTPGAAGAVACDIAPRGRASFIALVGTPRPGPLPPAAGTPVAMPAGRPADAATIAAVTRTADELTACVNAGGILRYYALWTDAMLRRTSARTGLSSAALPEPGATPSPAPAEYVLVFHGLSDVRVLPDGRVGARILWSYRDRPGPSPYTIFVKQDGRYLVDESLYVLPPKGEQGTPPASPES